VLETFDDGRMNIVVAGEHPFKVLERFEETEFPVGEIEPIDSADEPAADDAAVASDTREAFAELVEVFLAAIACVVAVLLIEFGSVAAALAIVIGSSLALSGSLAALWATGTALNVSSMVGMIMVVGIVAKNGILLLDFAARDATGTDDINAALVRAGSVRLRPILMTSLAAVAGLAPLAFGIGAGGQMQQPLAIAILGGVSLAILFSLIGVPLLYLLLAHRRVAPWELPAPRGG